MEDFCPEKCPSPLVIQTRTLSSNMISKGASEPLLLKLFPSYLVHFSLGE